MYIEIGIKVLNTSKEEIKEILCQNLLKEGKYFELMEVSEKSFYKQLKNIQKKDIEFEIGKKRRFNIHAIKESIKRKIKLGIFIALFSIYIKANWITFLTKQINQINIENIYDNEDLRKLEQIKKQYQDDISKYADEINELNLEDLEIIIKEMADMWKNIYGYKSPNFLYDEKGIFQYNLYYTNYGVCREFASDCAVRLNEINSSYNAQAVAVKFKDVYLNDLPRNIFGETEKSAENSFLSELLLNLIIKEMGNHMVVLLTIPDKNYTLLIDPTNPSIGLVDNGNIYIFGSNQVYKDYMEFVDVNYYKNWDEFFNYCKLKIQSYFNGVTPNELLEEYGIDNQNKTLNEVANIETKYRTFSGDMLTSVIKDEACGYETYTENDTIVIKPIDIELIETTTISEALYHVVNLQVKNDINVKKIQVYSYNEDIDLDKIDFNREQIFCNILDGLNNSYSHILKK